jgi:predicted O-linked N-acetylglucosamine transferase (SPINDLY family)
MSIRSNFANLIFKNGLQTLLKLIRMKSNIKCITFDDKLDKWSNYHDIGYLFSANNDNENALVYTSKAYDLSIKFNLQLDKKLLSFQNILAYSDYIYSDNEKSYKKCLEINNLIPDRPSFSFKNRIRNSKIKLGYLSSDFLDHAVSNFILPIFKNHDCSCFEIYLFSNTENVTKVYNELESEKKVKIVNILNVDSKKAAEMIYSLNIDILIDLNGHTANNRLEVFTYHPVPIQMTYLGFPNTTGLKSIKYRITDSAVDNPQTKQLYSEQLIRLKKCFLLYHPIHRFQPNPKETEKTIIIGIINKENKTSIHFLNVVKQILEKCQNVNILIKLECVDNTEERKTFYLEKLNMQESRLTILNKMDNGKYDKLYNTFDILLDPFPYSGTTTSCNALFNSIPVVTLYYENSHVHNVTSSLLINCGFPELVAKTQEEYINIVTNLVNKPSKIDKYKKVIGKRFLKLMDPVEFMHDYENVLTNLYEKDIIYKNNNNKENNNTNNNNNENDKIVINLHNLKEAITTNHIDKKVYICGCVKNCASFLEKVFVNIDKIVSLFDDYKIIIAEDSSNDNSLEILKIIKERYNNKFIILSVPENDNLNEDFTMRSKKISNARNEIIKYIYNENRSDFQYFIMMDMDDVSCGKMDTDVLNTFLEREKLVGNKYEGEWDSLSFNRKYYYDIWALSIEPYIFSCFHFPGDLNTVEVMRKYITNKLNNLKNNDLLECDSAFNGFAIYRISKFTDCKYDWKFKTNFDSITNQYKHKLYNNELAFGLKISSNTICHPLVNPTTDCEHRFFHMNAIEKSGARIRISPQCLFVD